MFRLLHLLLIGLTLLAYLVPIVDPTTFWPIAILGILVPWLWLSVFLFAVYWGFQKEKVIWLSLITLLLGWDAMTRLFAIPDSSDQSPEWSIVSFNGHAFRPALAENLDEKTGIEDFLSTLDTDIFCFQEYRRGAASSIMTNAIKTKTEMNYHYHDSDGRMIILSKFPIKNESTTYFANRSNGYQRVDIQTPQGWVRVYNIHLQTNAITGLASQVAENSDLREKQTWLTVKGMFSRYGRASRKRVAQARQILAEVQSSPYPVVLCGDFNEIPNSYMYGLFQENLQDAHLQQNFGLGSTYATNMPGIRIDYIFSSPNLEAVHFERLPKGFSDHRPIKASFAGFTE